MAQSGGREGVSRSDKPSGECVCRSKPGIGSQGTSHCLYRGVHGQGDLAHLRQALVKGLESGMTVNEVNEVLIHAYAYCGFPRSLRAIQTFMQVIEERKSMGIKDVEGREASAIEAGGVDMRRGRDILAEISGTSASVPKAGYAVFAPTIERFLKEHLFADLLSATY